MRFFASLFTTVLFMGLAVCVTAYIAVNLYQSPSELSEETYVIVEKGDGVQKISQKLADKHIIDYPIIINFFTYYQGIHTKMKAGEYALTPHISPQETIEKIIASDTVKHKITVIEGKTVDNILQEMTENEILSGDVTVLPPEGTLMPETYIFERGTKRDDLIRQMQQDQAKFLQEQWKTRVANLPLATPEDALILASIVEKETGTASERKVVASVFINRLRMGMRLQSDPTIIYGITKGKGTLGRALYRSDIMNNQSGYNTYIINALPPTPICNPSKEAIIAVLNPAETKYLYFVANGTGGHTFSENLSGHNENVQKWRVIEKTKKQQQNQDDLDATEQKVIVPIDKNIPIIKKQQLDDI